METFGELCGRIVRTVLAEGSAGAEALRTSEAQWRSLVQNCPDYVVTIDVETFEALRSAQGNPLHLCELALADEPGRRAPPASRASSARPTS